MPKRKPEAPIHNHAKPAKQRIPHRNPHKIPAQTIRHNQGKIIKTSRKHHTRSCLRHCSVSLCRTQINTTLSPLGLRSILSSSNPELALTANNPVHSAPPFRTCGMHHRTRKLRCNPFLLDHRHLWSHAFLLHLYTPLITTPDNSCFLTYCTRFSPTRVRTNTN